MYVQSNQAYYNIIWFILSLDDFTTVYMQPDKKKNNGFLDFIFLCQ